MANKRSFAHWPSRYVVDRAMQLWWIRQNSEAPWLSRQAVLLIEQWLRPGDAALEWGSGRSTAWLARRVGRLLSVEHNAGWHQAVAEAIDRLRRLADASLDFILADGKLRDHCALAAVAKLKPGGLLVVDDAHRHLPSAFAIPAGGRCASKRWERFRAEVGGWRQVWFSDGIYHDACFFKPGGGQ